MEKITIYQDAKQASIAMTALFASVAKQAVQSRGICHVSLSGGETPRKAYELLAKDPYCKGLPWQCIHIYWGDERCVPPTDSLSNQEMARQAFLNHVAIPAENIHPIVYEGSATGAAEKYETLLCSALGQEYPQFDFVFLGLGDDGHTASLFPGTDVLSVKDHWVSSVYLEKQNMYRVTLTPAILNQARVIAFLVNGKGKAQVVQNILEKTPRAQSFPAKLITPNSGELYWLLDQEAASLLK